MKSSFWNSGIVLLFILLPAGVSAQQLTPQWEELTASDWERALSASDSTCILPLGILEKHGPHAPMGSDLIVARRLALEAAGREYAVVFPPFYFGQVHEAKHLGGTFSLSSDLLWELLKETVDEIARNGFNKIVLVNGHGGNNYLLPYFVQSQLEEDKNYVTYLYSTERSPEQTEKVNALRKSDPSRDMHAGEGETSLLLHLRPDLVKLDEATRESGADQDRLDLPESLYTGIWWYARFPLHYAGKAEVATAELGKLMFDYRVKSLVKALGDVKNDHTTRIIQQEYFNKVEEPSPQGH
ncbi:creatininase family protein [Fodinibius sediminis]|nr:creatininase family protein [Fodinibius sediminis]